MKGKNKKRSWKQIVSVLSCVVVFCTTYALILPAVTMSKDTYCQKEEHTHTEQCYKSEEPLCGLEEGETKDAHVHDESCYENVEVARNLICGLEEDETHVHSEDCYQSEFETRLTCDQEEGEAVEGHTHGDECYKSEEPICNKEEHEHVHECYSNKEDVEDPNNWAEAYKDINKEEDAKTRILTVAKNELGYKENEANFEVDEKDEEHPYTRYGHLYEDMYGDWNNYFMGYVLKYANVQMNFDKDIDKWQNKTINDQKEEGEEGNVVFFRDEEGKTRTGIVTNIDDLKKEIRVIEGDVEGQVKEERVNKDKVIAYLDDEVTIDEEDTPLAGEGAEKEEDKLTQTAKDAEESVEVTAEYTKEAEIPEDAEFRVIKLEDSENGNPRFDIGFYVNDEEIEPKAEVSISIKYLNEELDGTEIIDYIHYKKDGSTETISSDVKTLEDGSVETKFKTDSFSVFEAEITVGVKKVEVEGADGEVEIGTEVTLTANPKGYKEDEKLYYQWQYNPVGYTEKEEESADENESEITEATDEPKTNEEDWYDVKGETNKNYTFQLTYENSDYLWRVKVDNKKIKEDDREYEEKTNIGPVGEEKLIQPKKALKLNLFDLFDQEEKDSESKEEEENNTLVTSKEINLSTYGINRTPSATYAGNSGLENLTDIPHNKTIEYKENDDYRLHLDFGPTAGSKPMDLIVIIDVSGSMEGSRLSNVIKTLNGESGSSQTSSYSSQDACEVAKTQKEAEGYTTTECTYKKKNWSFTYSKAQTGLINQFLSLNEENRIAFGAFSRTGKSNNAQTSDWFQGENNITQAESWVKSLSANGGTNYLWGLKEADYLLQQSINDSPDHAKHVIFLTDGEPTESFKDSRSNSLTKENWLNGTLKNGNGITTVGDGTKTSNTILNYTATGIKQFHEKYKDIDVSTIGYNLVSGTNNYKALLENGKGNVNKDVTDVEGIAWGRGEYFAYSDNDAIDKLISNFELIMRGPRCKTLELSDILSDYVDFNSSDVDIVVKAIPGEGQTSTEEKIIFHYKGSPAGKIVSNQPDVATEIINGDKTGANKDKLTHQVSSDIIPQVSIDQKTIQLIFNPDWELDPTYRYELSFNIQVTKEAYDEYDKTGYLHTGDEKSDYRDNNTSSNQPGFYSNMTGKEDPDNAAKLSFTYDGKLYSTEDGSLHKYQKPVVQVQLKELEIIKKDSTGNQNLADAKFNLYKVVAEGTEESSKLLAEWGVNDTVKLEQTDITSGEDGKLILNPNKLEKGTYYLLETSSPTGYNRLEKPIKLEVTSRTISASSDEKDVVEVNEGNVEWNNYSGKFEIYIKNTPGKPLPNTGGAGTKLFTFSGGAIIATSSLMYGYKKKSKRNRKGGQN